MRSEFATVPRNVAHHWLYRHWGHSDFGWLASNQCQFDLEWWTYDQILRIELYGSAHESYRENCARFQVNEAKRLNKQLASLPSIMFCRNTWPAPPIVLVTDGQSGNPKIDGLPVGYVLVEGNRRFSFALMLIDQGRFIGPHVVWVVRLHCSPYFRREHAAIMVVDPSRTSRRHVHKSS